MSQQNSQSNCTNGGHTASQNVFFKWIGQHAIAIITAIVAAFGSYYTLKSMVEVNKVQIIQNRQEIQQVRSDFIDQAKRNEQAIKDLSKRIDTLIFRISDRSPQP